MHPTISRLFEDKELESIKQAFAHDKIIIPALIKILEYRWSQKEMISLDDPNWMVKRSAYDGHNKEISWLINFLKEGQGGRGQKEEER